MSEDLERRGRRRTISLKSGRTDLFKRWETRLTSSLEAARDEPAENTLQVNASSRSESEGALDLDLGPRVEPVASGGEVRSSSALDESRQLPASRGRQPSEDAPKVDRRSSSGTGVENGLDLDLGGTLAVEDALALGLEADVGLAESEGSSSSSETGEETSLERAGCSSAKDSSESAEEATDEADVGRSVPSSRSARAPLVTVAVGRGRGRPLSKRPLVDRDRLDPVEGEDGHQKRERHFGGKHAGEVKCSVVMCVVM